MGRAKGQGLGRDAESGGQFRCGDADYHRWRTGEVTVGGEPLALVSKPGVHSFGELDPAAGLLLDHLEVGAADTVCDLNCGAGVVGTLAAMRAPGGRVWMADGNLLSVQAARRTLEANGVSNAEVAFRRGSDGYSAAPADVAVVRLPKGKIPTLQLLWDAYHVLKPGGRCYLAGGNDEGIRTALRQMEALFGDAMLLGYRGGHRVGMATRPAAPAERAGDFDTPWLDPERFHSFRAHLPGGACDVFSRPGVFSWDRLDRGSQALVEAMEAKGAERVLELGCGYGIVGTAAARAAPDARVTMVDVDVEAVRSSRRTVEANGVGDRCEVLASDAADAVADRRFDLVLANPPFHVGKATDLDVPAQFIRDAARVLEPRGRLFLVANRTLPYEAWVRECFGSCRTVLDGREFKVLAATR
jgi:16S rRNA (guanine1207-N2)-methyltransferase